MEVSWLLCLAVNSTQLATGNRSCKLGGFPFLGFGVKAPNGSPVISGLFGQVNQVSPPTCMERRAHPHGPFPTHVSFVDFQNKYWRVGLSLGALIEGRTCVPQSPSTWKGSEALGPCQFHSLACFGKPSQPSRRKVCFPKSLLQCWGIQLLATKHRLYMPGMAWWFRHVNDSRVFPADSRHPDFKPVVIFWRDRH